MSTSLSGFVWKLEPFEPELVLSCPLWPRHALFMTSADACEFVIPTWTRRWVRWMWIMEVGAASVLYRIILAVSLEAALKQEKLEQLIDCCIIWGKKRQASNRWWKRRRWVILDIDWIECTDRCEHDRPMDWQKNVLFLREKEKTYCLCVRVWTCTGHWCAWGLEQLLGLGPLLPCVLLSLSPISL